MALFKSNHAGFVQYVRPRTPTRYNNVTGEPIEFARRLDAEFGIFGPETTVFNPETGRAQETADIRGGFFDSYSAQDREGWTDEERVAVEEKLRSVAKQRPDYVQEIVAVQVPAPAPWQNYDGAKAVEVPKLAETLGLVPEALRYERENLNRATTVGALTKLMVDLGQEAVERSKPLTEFPEGSLAPGQSHGVRIGNAPAMTDSGIVKGTPGFVEKPYQVVV